MQDGHSGEASWLPLGLSFSTGVDSDERAVVDLGNENSTGKSDFRLLPGQHVEIIYTRKTYVSGCEVLPPLQLVCSLTSFNELGGPFDE